MHKQPDVTAATRKKIMDSFWDIYITTPIDKITISAITKSAGVHRSTFYEYFKDIYDLNLILRLCTIYQKIHHMLII